MLEDTNGRAADDALPFEAVRRDEASRHYAHYVLFLLCLTNILATVDRQIISVLLEPIKLDLNATDTEMSLLSGAAFVLFYAVFGIPVAHWADRGDRRRLLAIGVAVWSLATGASGLARTFVGMAVARGIVGIGEAAGLPTALSLIGDYYRRESRTKVIAIFNMSLQVGSIVLIPLLGLVAQAYGWRAALILLALPGLVIAVLVDRTIKEPRRGVMDVGGGVGLKKPTLAYTWRMMRSSPPFLLILLGTAIVGLGSGTLAAWGNAVMMRVFHVTTTEIGAIVAPIGAIAMIVGTFAGGYITSWAVKRLDDQRMVVLLPALAGLIGVPGGLLYAFGASWGWTIVGTVLGGLSLGFRMPAYQALMLDLVPANCRGMAGAASLIATTVIGFAGGPLIVGLISDALTPALGSVLALRRALIFAPVTLLIGCVPFFMALKYFNRKGLIAEQRD